MTYDPVSVPSRPPRKPRPQDLPRPHLPGIVLGEEIEGKAKKAKVIRAMTQENLKAGDFVEDGRRVVEVVEDGGVTIPIYSKKRYTPEEIKGLTEPALEEKPKPKPKKVAKAKPAPAKKALAKKAKAKPEPAPKPKPKPKPKAVKAPPKVSVKRSPRAEEPKPYPCLCGCSERVDRLFARGHVARLFGLATKRGGQDKVVKILAKAKKRLEAHPNWA